MVDNNTPVTIAPEEDDKPVWLSDTAAYPLPPSAAVADTRSQKAYIGLGDTLGQNQTQIRSSIQSGQEQQFREAAASTLTYQAAQKQEQRLIDARTAKGSSLTNQEMLNVLDPFQSDRKSADPTDVIEKAYSQKFISMSNTAAAYMKGTVIDDAVKDIPEHLALSQANSSELMTQLEFTRTMKENIDNEIQNQGIFPWLADQGKTMFQPYMELKMRDLVPEVGSISGGLLLGNNLKEQADRLFMLPTEEFKPRLTAIVAGLRKDNPTLASMFLDYVLGTGTSDRNLQNIFTVLGPLDYASIAKGGKTLLRSIELNNRVNTAFKQVVKEAAKSSDIPIKASLQEALGDVKSAGATRAADHIERAVTGNLNPVQDIKEDFTSNFRLDGDVIGDSRPGVYSRDELTKLKDSFYRSGADLYNRLTDLLRVNRTPVPLESEAAVRAYQAAVRADYPGEIILDIGSPQLMRSTSTYHIPFTYGNAEGRFFSDPETAYNYARMRGYADPRIESATGEVEKVAAHLEGSKSDLAAKARLEKSIPTTEKFLDTMKARASKKFVGPRLPGELENIQETIESTKNILAGYKDKLTELNKKIITTEPVIEQNGLGYKFTVLRPYKETDEVVRSYLLGDKKALSTSSLPGRSFASWKNASLGWIRSADDTLAFNESLNRKIAVYTQNVLKEWSRDELNHIEAVANQTKWYTPWNWYKKFTNKKMFEEFNEVLDYARKADDPKTGERGYFFQTPQDLDDHYQRYYQRSVSPQEVQAYFAHVKLVEGNRVLSEIAEFRNRARIGTEQHQIFTINPDGTKKASGFFDGIQMSTFPQGGGQIIIMGAHAGEERLYHLGANEIPGRDLQKYKDWVETGKAKIIRIYDPDSHPLDGFSSVGGERIRYILTSDHEFKPLGLNHVNRRGGGHFDVDAEHFVKQANMVSEHSGSAAIDKRRVFKRVYIGDNTFMPARNHVIAQDVAKKMTLMNDLMRNEKTDEAKALSKQLGIDWDKMESWYDPDRIVNGRKVGPRIDWNEPFYAVPRNKRIYDIDKTLETRVGKDSFVDASKTGSDAKQFQVDYNQARDAEDLFTLKDVGTRGNPLYKMETAPLVNPIPTMNRALNKAIRSTFMDDYKISAVEHWLAEAMPHLKAEESEIRSAPFYYFNNADFGAFKSATDPSVISNLLSNRFKVQQFVGMPSKVDTAIHGLTQILADEFYKKLGPEEARGPITRAATIIPLWALSKWQDPISGIRSLAFNSKLGLFAIPQFLVQSQTFANIWALGGRSGANGTFGAMLHQWSRVNKSEAFMEKYDDLYTKLNLFGNRPRPGEFIEANRELGKTGFEHVGGEYQLADDQIQYKHIKNEFTNFLDAGQVFFREGEKFTRLGAYYTAFREFREANPIKVLTDADRASILQKADLYTANMSRASAGGYNSSIFSLPMQFLTYQVRMAEMFFGKRLGETPLERAGARARILGVYAAMYGMPGALGVTGYPWADSIREEAMNRGFYGLTKPYVPGDNSFYDMMMNGVIAWQLALISGKFDYKKGNQYDVQGRWGTQGFTTLREAQRSDQTIWKIVGGAGVDTFTSTWAHTDPFWKFAWQLVSNDEEGNKFKVTPAHFLDLFSEVSSADLITRGIYALHTGRWISHNGSYIENTTASDVLFREITGFKTQDQSDIYLFHDIRKNEEAVQKQAEKAIIRDYQRGLDAARDKDYSNAQTYFTNARARMLAAGIPLDRRSQIMSSATRGYEPQTMTTEWDWATKHVPHGEEQTRAEAVTRRIQLQDYRNK